MSDALAIVVIIPLRTHSLCNQRVHWSQRAARARGERLCAYWHCFAKGVARRCAKHPLIVTLTRFAPRKLDSDNLAGAFKSIRDGVADALGIDDGSELVTWVYGQEKAKDYSVTIRIERKAE